jgi:hypothetical protein
VQGTKQSTAIRTTGQTWRPCAPPFAAAQGSADPLTALPRENERPAASDPAPVLEAAEQPCPSSAPAALQAGQAAGDCEPDSPLDSPTGVVQHWSPPARACSLPASLLPSPSVLAARLEAVVEELRARTAAEAAAQSEHQVELEVLRLQLREAQDSAAHLRVTNQELQAEVVAARSAIPAAEAAYENLKGAFFKLQCMYTAANARLGGAQRAIAQLQARLQTCSRPRQNIVTRAFRTTRPAPSTEQPNSAPSMPARWARVSAWKGANAAGLCEEFLN